jgi:hypothetical protein
VSKATTIYWLSMAVLFLAPLGMPFRFRLCGFFDGPRGD